MRLGLISPRLFDIASSSAGEDKPTPVCETASAPMAVALASCLLGWLNWLAQQNAATTESPAPTVLTALGLEG